MILLQEIYAKQSSATDSGSWIIRVYSLTTKPGINIIKGVNKESS